MSKIRFFSAITPILTLITTILLFCELPSDPRAPENTKITPVFKSSTGVISTYSLIDTAGRLFSYGAALFLPENFDSIHLEIKSNETSVFDTTFLSFKTEVSNDTAWLRYKFDTPGARTVILTPYSSLHIDPLVANIFIVESVSSAKNHQPNIAVSGKTILLPGELCSLNLQLTDPDAGQVVNVTLKDQPDEAVLQNTTFSWTAPTGFVGLYPVKFIASDNGNPQMFDTAIITITVTITPNAPSIEVFGNRSMHPLEICTLTIRVFDKDSGQNLTISMSGNPEGSVLKNDSFFLWTIPKSFTGEDTVIFKVTDNGNPALSTIAPAIITVSPISIVDVSPPLMSNSSPTADSTKVNASSITIAIKVTDQSGVAVVTASFGSNALPVTSTPPIYSVSVMSLVANQFNIVRFIATDSSANSNKDTLSVSVKYDPTMADSIGPVINQVSGPISGVSISDPLVTIVDLITDPSGIDSVFWRLNNAPIKSLLPVNGKSDQFSLSDSVKREHLDTIIVTAVDKSTQHNQTTQVIILDYIIAPTFTTQPVSQYVCAGTQASFSVVASGTEPLSYQWRKGTSNFMDIPGATNATYSFSTVASDNATTISCLVSNGGTVNAMSNLCTLTVNSASTKPTAAATPASFCTGGSSVLSVSDGILGKGASWKWYTSKTSVSALTSTTVSPSIGTWYYVKGTGGSCGDSPWDSVYVTVIGLSISPTGIAIAPATVCSGTAVTLALTGGTLGVGAIWTWFTDAQCTQSAVGTSNADGSQIVVTPSSTTTYYVHAAGICNTTIAISKIVTVNTPSTAPTGIASASPSVCPGSSVALTVSGGSLGTGAQWKWYTNSGCTQAATGIPVNNGVQFSVTPSSQTTYYVRAEGICGNTPAASKAITVNTPPAFTATLTGYDVCEPGGYMNYSLTATGSTPLSYVWYNGAGTELTRSPTLDLPAPTVGTTQFYCVATDVNGCSTKSNTATQTVHQATVITRQPVNTGGYQVTERLDTVQATGEGTLTYQWQYQLPNGTWSAMATGPTISIVPTSAFTGYASYIDTFVSTNVPVRVRIVNSFGCEMFSETVAYGVAWGI